MLSYLATYIYVNFTSYFTLILVCYLSGHLELLVGKCFHLDCNRIHWLDHLKLVIILRVAKFLTNLNWVQMKCNNVVICGLFMTRFAKRGLIICIHISTPFQDITSVTVHNSHINTLELGNVSIYCQCRNTVSCITQYHSFSEVAIILNVQYVRMYIMLYCSISQVAIHMWPSPRKQVLSAHSILRILGYITQPVYTLQAQNFDIWESKHSAINVANFSWLPYLEVKI